MTKKEYIDWIRNNLQQIDETRRYHPVQVEYAIEKVLNQIYYDMAVESPKDLERYSVLLTAQSSTLDATTARYVTSLSVGYVDLPLKASGVLEVRLPTDTTLAFVPMTSMEMSQAYGADATLGSTIIGFSAQKEQIEYFGMTETSAALTIRIVQQFSDYSLGDEVFLPYGKDYDITNMVMATLSNIPPKDLVNDNSDISYGE